MSVTIVDRRLGLTRPGALVELSEADLRELSRISAAEAKRVEEDARSSTDRLYARTLLGDSRRFERVANDLRDANQNGAAPAATGPRPDQEALAP